jgi:hypothetical protein
MIHDFRDRYAIVGVGISLTTRTAAQGKSAQQLEAWAVKSAIEDAGLRRQDIDGAVHAAAQFGADAYSRKLGPSSNFCYPIGRMAGAVAGVFFATQALATGNRQRPIRRWFAGVVVAHSKQRDGHTLPFFRPLSR